jgi:hypothetical protein
MPTTNDFRNYAFDPARVDAAGKNIGQKVYWKLYAIENLVRVIVHSILTAQVGANWWTVAVDPGIQGSVQHRRSDYTNRPWHSTPGKHDVYYAFLSDLSKIITANSHLFRPVIPDIDQWIARIGAGASSTQYRGAYELASQDGPPAYRCRLCRPPSASPANGGLRRRH